MLCAYRLRWLVVCGLVCYFRRFCFWCVCVVCGVVSCGLLFHWFVVRVYVVVVGVCSFLLFLSWCERVPCVWLYVVCPLLALIAPFCVKLFVRLCVYGAACMRCMLIDSIGLFCVRCSGIVLSFFAFGVYVLLLWRVCVVWCVCCVCGVLRCWLVFH